MRRAFTLLLALLATGSLIYGQTKNDGNAGEALLFTGLSGALGGSRESG